MKSRRLKISDQILLYKAKAEMDSFNGTRFHTDSGTTFEFWEFECTLIFASYEAKAN